jgi:hypothetical protein
LIVAAVAGVGLGIRAAYRSDDGPDVGAVSQAQDADTLTAHPLVDITPPPSVTAQTDQKADSSDADADKADDLAAQTAEAQALQAKPTATPGDIDQIMTSAAEKPPAATKTVPQAAAPNAPVKSDVPF